eukprot:sb/3477499/
MVNVIFVWLVIDSTFTFSHFWITKYCQINEIFRISALASAKVAPSIPRSPPPQTASLLTAYTYMFEKGKLPLVRPEVEIIRVWRTGKRKTENRPWKMCREGQNVLLT